MHSLKGLSNSLHFFMNFLNVEPCATDLASIYTGRDSVAFSQPEASMGPIHQMVLSRKLPYFVTTNERTKHMFSRFGNVMSLIGNHA